MKKFPLLDVASPGLTKERATEILHAVWITLLDAKDQKTSLVLGATASAASLDDDRLFNLLITKFNKRVKLLSPDEFLSFFGVQTSSERLSWEQLILCKLTLLGIRGRAANSSTIEETMKNRHVAFFKGLKSDEPWEWHDALYISGRCNVSLFSSNIYRSLSKGIGKVHDLQREFTRFFLDVLLPSSKPLDAVAAIQLKFLLAYGGLTGLKIAHEFCETNRSRVWLLDEVCKQAQLVDKGWEKLQAYGDEAPYARMLGHSHPLWNMARYPDLVFCAKHSQPKFDKLRSGSKFPIKCAKSQLDASLDRLLYEDEDEELRPESQSLFYASIKMWGKSLKEIAVERLAREADAILELTPAVCSRLLKMGRESYQSDDQKIVPAFSPSDVYSFIADPRVSPLRAQDKISGMADPLNPETQLRLKQLLSVIY